MAVLTDHCYPVNAPSPRAAMLIEYVTHASLHIKSANVTLLTDPFFFLDPPLRGFMCFFPPRELKLSHFGRLDFVFCSHIHDDHSHRKTLTTLKEKIGTILLPAGKPDLEGKIADLGFRKVVLLENEKTVDLGRGLKVTNFHDRNGFDTALVIELEGKTILHQNDCQLDFEAFRRMADRFRIAYAFYPHTFFQDLYPLLLPRPDEELRTLSEEREREGLAYLLQCLEILKPKMVIPYAYTVAYFNRDQLRLNAFGRTTPPLFRSAFLKKFPDTGCLVLQPGDVIDAGTGGVIPYRKENLWGSSIGEFLENLRCTSEENRKRSPIPDFGEPQTFEKKLLEHFRKRVGLPFPGEFGNQVITLHIVGKKDRQSYFLDIDGRTFGKDSDKLPILEITLPAMVLGELLSQRYDPFMILYCYRISFKLNILLGLNPRQECAFYTMAIISLFNPALHKRLWGEKTFRQLNLAT